MTTPTISDAERPEAWVIVVAGYGSFVFKGTEAAAEDMRSHKARWERGIGRKRPATEEEAATEKAGHCWNHPLFNNKFVYGDCDCDDANCLIDAQDRIDAAMALSREPSHD